MYAEKPYEGRCSQKMEFVGYLMYGEVRGHDVAFGTDKNCFIDPVLG